MRLYYVTRRKVDAGGQSHLGSAFLYLFFAGHDNASDIANVMSAIRSQRGLRFSGHVARISAAVLGGFL